MVMIVENALMNLLLSKLLGGHDYLSRQVIILKYKQKVGVQNQILSAYYSLFYSRIQFKLCGCRHVLRQYPQTTL